MSRMKLMKLVNLIKSVKKTFTIITVILLSAVSMADGASDLIDTGFDIIVEKSNESIERVFNRVENKLQESLINSSQDFTHNIISSVYGNTDDVIPSDYDIVNLDSLPRKRYLQPFKSYVAPTSINRDKQFANKLLQFIASLDTFQDALIAGSTSKEYRDLEIQKLSQQWQRDFSASDFENNSYLNMADTIIAFKKRVVHQLTVIALYINFIDAVEAFTAISSSGCQQNLYATSYCEDAFFTALSAFDMFFNGIVNAEIDPKDLALVNRAVSDINPVVKFGGKGIPSLIEPDVIGDIKKSLQQITQWANSSSSTPVIRNARRFQ